MAISKKISELDVLTSPQDLTKLFPPLFAQDGSPLNIRMSMAEVLKSATQVAINSGTLTGSSSPALSITQTWNNAATTFTGALLNVTDTASNAASKLLDLQVGGVSMLAVNKSGVFPGNLRTQQAVYIGTSATGSSETSGWHHTLGLTLGTLPLCFGSAGYDRDVYVQRDAADRLALRRSTNAQRFSVYRTWTSSSNFERGVMSWYDSASDDGTAGTVLRIGTEKGSLGGTARAVSIVTDGTERIGIDASGSVQIAGNGIGSGGITLNNSRNMTFLGTLAGTVTWGDIAITRPAANILGITNGSTGPGQLAIDNVQGTNFERLKAEWDTNVARFGTSKGGSGTARDFAIITDNTVRVTFAAAGGQTAADGHNMAFGTSTGTKIGTATGQKIGFWNATPVVQQVLATGAGATVDNVITLLQTLGLCKQS